MFYLVWLFYLVAMSVLTFTIAADLWAAGDAVAGLLQAAVPPTLFVCALRDESLTCRLLPSRNFVRQPTGRPRRFVVTIHRRRMSARWAQVWEWCKWSQKLLARGRVTYRLELLVPDQASRGPLNPDQTG